MNHALPRRLVVFVALAVVGAGCARASEGCTSAASPRSGPFEIHEWGLFAIDANDGAQALSATQIGEIGGTPGNPDPEGTGGNSYKPVIYVHLDRGVREQRLDVRIGIPRRRVLERWPPFGEFERSVSGWDDVVVRAGACSPADVLAPPTWSSSDCRGTRDGFCEAAEIPRYTGDRVSCLHVGEAATELLLYRTEPVPTAALPLRLVGSGESFTVERVGSTPIEGPIFWITTTRLHGPVAIRRLDSSAFGRPLAPADASNTLLPDDVRAALATEAIRRGLSPGEAAAFVDAWAPAYFDPCERSGPVASGVVPRPLRPAMGSLLYFAPESAIDVMIPLATEPPARETHRVFLVRSIDGRPLLEAEPAVPDSRLHVDFEVPPRVRMAGLPRVTGGLSSDVARRVIQRHYAPLRACYEAELAGTPDLVGRLTITFTIDPTGVVTTSAVRGTSFARHASMRACALGVVNACVFPSADPPVPTQAVVSFDFVRD